MKRADARRSRVACAAEANERRVQDPANEDGEARAGGTLEQGRERKHEQEYKVSE